MVFTAIVKGVSRLIESYKTSALDPSNISRRDAIILGSSGLAVTAVLIGLISSYNNNDSDLAPALSVEETKLILTALLEKVKLLTAKMVNAANNIKQQIQSQGQDMEDSKIMSNFILPHFTSGYRDIQNQILSEFDVEEFELEEATKYFIAEGDEKVKEIAKKIRKFYHTCGGDVDLDDGEDISSATTSSKGILPFEMVVEMLEVISQVVSAKTDEYITAFKEEYGVPRDRESVERFQQGMMSLSESAESIVVKKYDVSHDDLENSLKKYANRQELLELYYRMQTESQMKLQSHGLFVHDMGEV